MGIDRDAFPFAAAWLVVAGLLALWSPWASIVPLALLAFTLYFFRDPERTPASEPGAVVSPADGRVLHAADGRISIFLNLTNVHVCRAPVSGLVGSVVRVPGRFLAAWKDEASEQNERARIELENPAGRVAFTLVAGLVARRIVCRIAPGQRLATGARIGLIRFGSRVDLELPPGAELAVARGERVVAGETVIARLPQRG